MSSSSHKARLAAEEAVREAHRLALRSAHEAGYRRGKDEQDRDLNTRHDQAITKLNIEMARLVVETREKTVAVMDRETVKGWLAVSAFQNQSSPNDEIAVLSVRLANAIARELTRAYDKEKQS